MPMLVKGIPLSPGKLAGVVLIFQLPGVLSGEDDQVNGAGGKSGAFNSIVEAARSQIGMTVSCDPA